MRIVEGIDRWVSGIYIYRSVLVGDDMVVLTMVGWKNGDDKDVDDNWNTNDDNNNTITISITSNDDDDNAYDNDNKKDDNDNHDWEK